MKTEVGEKLNQKGIVFKEVVLGNVVHTVKDVASQCSCNSEQVLKTILLNGDKNLVLAVISGNKRLNKDKIQKITNQRIRMANPEQVKEVTGFNVGSVSPFLLRKMTNLMLLADSSLLESDELFMGSGVSSILISMDSSQFINAFNGRFEKIT